MIQTRQLRFSYNAKTQFAFPDLACAAGDTLLITGASGMGKTTLLHLLGGLLPPSSGQIEIAKTDVGKLSGRALDRFRGQHIGIVFQQAHFVASLSVLENLVLAGWLAKGQRDIAKAKSLLERLDILEHSGKKPAQLSIGQQQRAAIARALMSDPVLLLADEPTSSLDDQNARLVADLLFEQAQQARAALLVVTHDQRLKQIFHTKIELT
jgi:ABC-type lipoprotein export system ATPase subunit